MTDSPTGSNEQASSPGQSSSRASTGHGSPALFAGPPPEPPRRNLLLISALSAVVIAILAGVLLHKRVDEKPAALNALLPIDAYSSSLAFTDPVMSESTSLSGGKSTFIDGHVKNTGSDTLTGITMQVVFANDVGLSPQVETLPLTLIRTREPYVDTEPVSAAPLKPGDQAEFRLIFETVSGNWNQQMPELRTVHVAKR